MVRPEQRKVVTRIFTPTGWLVGTLHLPAHQDGSATMGLLAFLNQDNGFLTLTEVQWPWSTSPLSFLALQRQAAMLVVADVGEMGVAGPSGEAHHVSCLLDGGVVMGTLDLPRGERVSDRLTRSEQLFPLHDCTIAVDGEGGQKITESAPIALVNALRLVGVAES